MVPAPEAADPALTGAWCRILAHRVLAAVAPEAEASLSLAPDRRLVGNLDTLLARWLWPQDLALWRHEAGIDWWDLAEAALIAAPAPAGPAPAALLAQARGCEARRLPRDAGACDTGMIWRRHRAEPVVRLMEAWWAELEAAPGLEAIALYAALEDREAPPALGRGSCRRRSARPGTTPSWRSARRRPAPRRAGSAARCRWPSSMPRSTPARPRPSSAAASSARWSPPAIPGATTCATPPTSPACATGWWC